MKFAIVTWAAAIVVLVMAYSAPGVEENNNLFIYLCWAKFSSLRLTFDFLLSD